MHKVMRKPPNLIYGVNDRPSFWVTSILGLQHGALLISSLMASVLFARELGLSSSQSISLINVALLAGGLSCILQATKKWSLGSGYFCVHSSSYIYIPASIAAAHSGGLSLVFGMTAASGLFQLLLARVAGRLRVIFPPEVAGLVVAMVGLALAPYAVKSLFGLSGDDLDSELKEVLVGLGTLSILVALNVWGKKNFKLFSILAGIVFGYLSAYALGVLPMEDLTAVRDLKVFSLPHIEHQGFSFDIIFLIPFLIAAICSSLKLTGDIITCQKINDLEWKRVDMKTVKAGINAEGMGNMAAGLLGGTGLAASSSNIGMSYATGATSRYIGYVTGIFFIGLSFFPQSAFILSNMPTPVVGAITVYAACFMIVTGWSIIMTRMIDARKTFVVGISLVMGMSVLVVPEIYDSVPDKFMPILGSSIALTAVTGVMLTLIFRIGIASRAKLTLDFNTGQSAEIHDFFVDMGGKWGARRDVVRKAAAASVELYEYVSVQAESGKIDLTLSFDEYNLRVEGEYQGPKVILNSHRPGPDELLEDDQALANLSGFLIRQYADSINQETVSGRQIIKMNFNH